PSRRTEIAVSFNDTSRPIYSPMVVLRSMFGPGVQSRARLSILSGNNHPLFNAVTVWPEGDSLRDYPMCQNSNKSHFDEVFVQLRTVYRRRHCLSRLARN